MRPIVLALAATVLAPLGASAQSLSVKIDQAARLTLPRPARDVIVGNPMIADVTMLDSRHLAVTGKSFGVTNLLVVDANGRTMYNRQILISSADAGHVQVYRAADLYNYACSPRCERSPMAGEPDTGGAYTRYAGSAKDYVSRNKDAAQAAAQGQPAP
ncbi:MAG TPA: pilus assembly protein N-terminal domain-containing protein [Caulobacteraceae bacterium]|nr:pilus assembly protein N-terminal domain-containing protein [Caulobacteraceae bacterium]